MSDMIFSISFYFTQSLLMILLGMKLLKIKRECKQVLKSISLYTLGIWLVRRIYDYFSMPLGTHTIILGIVFCLVIKMSLNINFNYALSIALFDFILIMLGSCILIYTNPETNFNIVPEGLKFREYIIFPFLENSFILGVLVFIEITKFDLSKVLNKMEKYN